MKINAIFIENKANFGKPQFAGFVETFDDVPEMCAYALPNFFSDRIACKTFAKKLRECFDAKGDPENFFDSIVKTNLYGWINTWKISKNEITIYVMKNLFSLDPLKPSSGIGKSSTDESTLNENNVPECWKIFIVFRDGDNDYARTYSKKIQVFHSKEEAEKEAKEIKAQTPEVKTVSVNKFIGWEGAYEFADKN